jgi:hypothetical protein
MRIVDVARRLVGTEAELSARIVDLPHGRREHVMWFRFPGSYYEQLTELADPFVAALLLPAMRARRGLVVEGPVSGRLLDGVRQIMTLRSRWHWDFHEVPIRARHAADGPPPPPPRVASFFSGGVDSFYTVLKHRGRPDSGLTDLIYLDHPGADFDPDKQRVVYDSSLPYLRAVARDLGLELVTGRTNVRELTDRFVAYEIHSHGACLAAAGLCLAPRYRRIYFPSTFSYAEAIPWGSHPMVEPLWSTEALEFVHDGCEASRAQKISWQVARSPIALDHLRTCTSNEAIHRGLSTGAIRYFNCGRCEKDIRTMLALRAAGVLDRARTFETELTPALVQTLTIGGEASARFAEQTLGILRQYDAAPELQAILEAKIRRYRSRLAPRLRSWVTALDHHVLGNLLRKARNRLRRSVPHRSIGMPAAPRS